MDASAEDVDRLLREKKVVIIDFYATWCGPCKAYSPKFDRLEREMRRAVPDASFAFVSVDIDRHQDVAREAKVMSVPTTVAWTMGDGILGSVVGSLTRGRVELGRRKKKQVLRFSGDRPWPEMVRTFTKLLETEGS